MKWGICLVLSGLVSALLAGEGAPSASPDGPAGAAGRVVYLNRGGNRGNLLMIAPRGEGEERVLKERALQHFRATPAGTILTWDHQRAEEIDAEGKTVWEFSWKRVEGMAIKQVLSIAPLSDGHLLVSARLEGGACLVASVDREGRVSKRMTPPGLLRAVQALGGEGIAALDGGQTIVEIGWDGKLLRTVPLPEEYERCLDMVRTADGRYIVAALTTVMADMPWGRKSGGRVAEFDADGKAVWEAAHGFPVSLHLLPDGTVLAGGGSHE